jgi:Fic family protein
MTWNREQPDWPNFTYDSGALEPLEKEFRLRSGELIGACKHIGAEDQAALKIDLISDEAVKTSEIQGEILDRANVQSQVAGGPGFEPRLTESESAVLPLNYPPSRARFT